MRPIPSVAVVGSEPGVGKTTVATMLSSYLASLGLRILHLDGTAGIRTVAAFSEVDRQWFLEDVCVGLCDLQDAVAEGPRNVSVVSSRANVRDSLDVPQFYSLVRATDPLADDTDALVVDECSGGDGQPTILSGATLQSVVVLREDPESVMRASDVIRTLTDQFRMERFYALVNFASSADAGVRALRSLVDQCGTRPLVQVLPIGAMAAGHDRWYRLGRASVQPEGLAIEVQKVAKLMLSYIPVPSGRIEYFSRWRRA